MKWFEVDKAGLRKLMQRRGGKAFVIAELLQNAWDAPGVTEVDLDINPVAGHASAEVTIADDSPTGFVDLDHAFTLFAESGKKSDPTLRGRFNLGEKLVLALCSRASISTTTGTVIFDQEGRHDHPRRKRAAGTVFEAVMDMTRAELAEATLFLRCVIPPSGIITRINGSELPPRTPLLSFDCALPTEIAGEDGILRRTSRKTTVSLYAPADTPHVCEMGIPVVEGDWFDVDVGQKVPLSLERDALSPAYLRELRAAVVSHASHLIPGEQSDSAWISDAIEHRNISPAAVGDILAKRFGDKIVAYDPSDREANDRAAAAGYKVLSGGTFSKSQWENVRASGAALPAGKVTPTPKPFDPDGAPAQHADMTPAMSAFSSFCKTFAREATGAEIEVSFLKRFNAVAAYGGRRLSFNVGHLKTDWFEGPLREEQLDLLIHELGHEYEPNHFSQNYNDALTRLGARAAFLAISDPGLFDISRYEPGGIRPAM